MSSVPALTELVQYRWTLPLLAELSTLRGSKVVTLCHRLGVTRPSLRRALGALIELGLAQPNPGYGHPMRPEYILTEAGEAIGAASERLVAAARAHHLEALAFQKWSLPVVQSLGVGASRFGEIQTSLSPITARALSLSLKNLGEASVVHRTVSEAYPPVSTYALTETGIHLASLTAELGASFA